jgi:hypothetical protein
MNADATLQKSEREATYMYATVASGIGAVIAAIAAVFAVVQAQSLESATKYTELRVILSALNELERQATQPDANSPCGAGEDALEVSQ